MTTPPPLESPRKFDYFSLSPKQVYSYQVYIRNLNSPNPSHINRFLVSNCINKILTAKSLYIYDMYYGICNVYKG